MMFGETVEPSYRFRSAPKIKHPARLAGLAMASRPQKGAPEDILALDCGGSIPQPLDRGW